HGVPMVSLRDGVLDRRARFACRAWIVVAPGFRDVIGVRTRRSCCAAGHHHYARQSREGTFDQESSLGLRILVLIPSRCTKRGRVGKVARLGLLQKYELFGPTNVELTQYAQNTKHAQIRTRFSL